MLDGFYIGASGFVSVLSDSGAMSSPPRRKQMTSRKCSGDSRGPFAIREYTPP